MLRSPGTPAVIRFRRSRYRKDYAESIRDRLLDIEEHSAHRLAVWIKRQRAVGAVHPIARRAISGWKIDEIGKHRPVVPPVRESSARHRYKITIDTDATDS